MCGVQLKAKTTVQGHACAALNTKPEPLPRLDPRLEITIPTEVQRPQQLESSSSLHI